MVALACQWGHQGRSTPYQQTQKTMTEICITPHKLPRFQITVGTDTRVISHVCAALNVVDAMDRIRAAYPGQELEQMQVKHLNERRRSRVYDG